MSDERTEKPLPPAMQVIADRYGMDLFNAALRLASMNVAVDELLRRTQTSDRLHMFVNVIMAGLGDLSADLIEAKGWHLADVSACIADIADCHRQEAPRIVVTH